MHGCGGLSVKYVPHGDCQAGEFFYRLRNDLYCVGWGVKLYSIQSRRIFHSVTVNNRF